MQLERIGVALRPRSSREAIDLGTALLRAHARAVWSAWFAFTVPIFLLCQLLAWLLDIYWLGIVLVWWLKPLFDRVPLYVLSRAVFDQPPRWRDTLRGQLAWPWAGTLTELTMLRIDSHRALRLPLVLLEGLPRKQRAARWRVLRRPIAMTVSGLTYGCVQFELVLFLSVWLFALLLIPRELLPLSFSGAIAALLHQAFTTPGWMAVVATLAYLAMSVIEPLYVAAGFALYLNRRTQLEAWDIDLTFRRLRRRLLEAGRMPALLFALLLAGGGLLPHRAYAAATPVHATAPVAKLSLEQSFHQPLGSDDARFAAAMHEVYRDRRFGGERSEWQWTLKPWASTDKPTPRPLEFPLGNLLSRLFSGLLWLLLAVALIALGVYAWRRWAPIGGAPALAVPKRVPTRATLTVDAPLPDDLAGATRALWQAQRRREALALLYRGSVVRAAAALRMPAPADATEADWLRHATQLEDGAARSQLSAIVRTWQYAAYAGRYPDDAGIDALLRGWPAQPAGSP